MGLTTLLRDLVIANRILAHEGVVDAYGHVSLRHPDNPERFLLSQSRSPELVTLGDISEFALDGEPVDQHGRTLYMERFIHAGILAARPDVQAVIHNHSPAVVAFSVTKTALRPIIHVASLIGPDIPVWDIRERFGDTSLLVTNMDQAHDLATCLEGRGVALMRGHGCVAVGSTLKQAVMTDVYVQLNAQLLMDSLRLGEVTYLSPGEIALMSEAQMKPSSADRAWEYWLRRAGCEGI